MTEEKNKIKKEETADDKDLAEDPSDTKEETEEVEEIKDEKHLAELREAVLKEIERPKPLAPRVAGPDGKKPLPAKESAQKPAVKKEPSEKIKKPVVSKSSVPPSLSAREIKKSVAAKPSVALPAKELIEKKKPAVVKIFELFAGQLTKTRKRIVAAAIVLAVLILILGLAGFGKVLYKYQWNNKFVNSMVKIIPYPAATVNFAWLSYTEFREDVDTLDRFFERQEQLTIGGAINPPTPEELKKNVLDRMIKDQLVKKALRKYDLRVTAEETEEEFNKTAGQADAGEDIDKILNELYQWDRDKFKKKVVKPYLMRQKLQQALLEDTGLSEELKDLNNYLEDQQKKARIKRFIDLN